MSVQKADIISIPAETAGSLKYQYICYACRTQFDLSGSGDLRDMKPAECPSCGSLDVRNVSAPCCSIESPGEMGELMWRYLCHHCRGPFETPVPRGPREEKETACPGCGSRDVQRIKGLEQDACPPGG